MLTLTVGSLFSGIGGLDLGLERAGMSVQWQVEKDEYARKVLEKNWPGILPHRDICHVHGRKHCSPGLVDHGGCVLCLRNVDLICGGFPCQDISVAGRGGGLDGARSGLWREFHRIIDEIRPKWVLIENVPALRTRGLDVVLRDLSSSGYDAVWDGLPASAFGAPHRRDRIFIVAYPQRESLRLQSRWLGWKSGQGALESGRDGDAGDVADAECLAGEPRRLGNPFQGPGGRHASGSGVGSNGVDGSGEHPWAVEPKLGRVAHGTAHRVDRLRCLGNAVVPQIAEYVGRLIMESERG